MKTHQVNLKDASERATYSAKLQIFEAQFSYPLGDKKFHIVHGRGKGCDYFSYFEMLGIPSCLVLEEGDQIVGVVVAVLRLIGGKSIWYLCDYKIAKSHRGKKLYRKWMWKYFLSHYTQCQTMFGVNMSAKENNGLVGQAKHVFALLGVEAQDLYLHQTTVEAYAKKPKKDLVLYTTTGYKDIYIDDAPVPMVHLLTPEQAGRMSGPKSARLDLEKLLQKTPQAKVLWLNSTSWTQLEGDEVQKVSLIHRKGGFANPSSAEV